MMKDKDDEMSKKNYFMLVPFHIGILLLIPA